MEITIDELKKEQNFSGSVDYGELMDERQQVRGNYYAEQYLLRKGEMQTDLQYWEYLEKLYLCIRELPSDIDEAAPHSFIPLVTPCVEGQVASMIDSNIEFRHISNNPAHQIHMRMLDAASDYYRDKTMHRQYFKDFARYYCLLGNQHVKVEWDSSSQTKSGHQGLPRISVPPMGSVLIDGRIKDTKDIQRAEYIIQEFPFQSIAWARKKYGDDKADAISNSYPTYIGAEAEQSIDDIKTFTLLEVWTRDNEQGNLQLIEMDTNGLILYESDPTKPVYENVDNEYPFGTARMIPRMGNFFGIGDGAILAEMQETVNKLVDELEIAARFSAQTRTYVDPDAKIDPNEVTSDPSKHILAKDPRGNIFVVPGTGINPIIQSMVQFFLVEAQKATRFHESMSGTQMNVSATATQINTQQAQGHVGIKDKKTDISTVMAWADMYALKLCMEFWDKPFWATVTGDSTAYIDMPMLRELPQVVPISFDEIENNMEQSRLSGSTENTMPKYMEAKDEDGSPIVSEIEFSTKVIIGESMPKGRTDVYNMLLGLAQMSVMGSDGQPKPLITADRLKELFEDLLGFKLQTDDEEMTGEMEGMMDTIGLNSINPIGNNETVQTPTNLQQTVPQMPGGDSRRVQI